MKKFFGSFSFVASLSLATGLSAAEIQSGNVDTIYVVPSRTSTSAVTNTVTITNYVYDHRSWPTTQPSMSAQTEPSPTQYVPPQPEPQYVPQPQPQYYPGVVVTPAGRPVEMQGQYVPIGGWSYGSNRRSGSGQVAYRSQVVDRRSGPVDVFYSGQSTTVSGTISVPGGYGNSSTTIINGGSGRRPVALAPARVHYAAPPRVHYYTAPKVHVPAY